MSLLSFRDVHKSYGDTPALRGVSLEVREGEVFGLLGPNGAGKTTLIRILMDIIRADSGSVTLFGVPRNRDQLDRIGYLPEDRGLYTKQKVLDVMAYFGSLKGLNRREARARSRQWLERMSLSEAAEWRVERLSKGMGQKVQIAATLLGDPTLCVLDEPFSGLDPINVRLVQDIIHERRRRGWTTVLSTHQMNQVEALCDRVALINRGKLMVYGRVDEVRERYSSPEVLLRLDGEPPRVPGVSAVARSGNSDWRLRLEEGVAPTEVLRSLVRQGARVEHFERFLAPMEEIFIQVVQAEEQP
jgi:ABC-2 type transport system ATP-binding protein